MFHESENPCFSSRNIDLVRIGQPQTSDDVKQVETAIECVEEGPVCELELSPIASEVVVGIGQRVHYELHCDASYGEYAQYWRALLHGVVVFEYEPLGTDAYAYG
jgi:hypothetical protein